MEKPLIIGLPRAMLYDRFQTLWQTFFRELGAEVAVSPPTDRQIMEDGAALAIDEACLSVKVFLGHVKALLGKCDYILIPWVVGFGRRQELCTRFQSLPDLTRNVFRDSGQRFLSYQLDEAAGLDEKSAFLDMGKSLGFSPKAVKKAYGQAKKEEQAQYKAQVKAEEQLYSREGIKILVAAHSYVLQDAYLGRTVMDGLKKLDVTPIRAHVVDRDEALKRSLDLSSTCKWAISRELLGSIAMHRDKVDGVVLLGAFPCGPDSMVNDLLSRKLHGLPLLNLVLDSQSGTAGVETRLESFVDIIRLKKEAL